MKVTYLLNQFPCYSETFVIDQINGLIDRGIDVSIIAMTEGENQDNSLLKRHNLMSRAVFVKSMHRASQSKRLEQLIDCCAALFKPALLKMITKDLLKGRFSFLPYIAFNRQLGRRQSDVIIAHFGPTAVQAHELQSLGLLDGKIFAIFHGYDISQYKMLDNYTQKYRALFKTDSLMLPISRLWQQRLLDMGCPKEKVIVNRMGIDANRLAFAPRVQEAGVLKILSVARHTEKKGLTDSIKAMSILKGLGVEFQYDIIGTGPLMDCHQQLISELDLSGSVNILGYRDPEFINDALEKTDIFLLPSVTASCGDMEGVPVSLMEAMAKGVICLSTLHSGIPELIENNQSGFLVPEHSPEAIAKMLQQLSQMEAEQLHNIKLAARAKVVEEFNQERIYNELAKLIQAVN